MGAAAGTRVILAGFMGTGKTEVGRRLAQSLGWSFVDTDALVESAAGRSVAAIFADEGEAAFRARERDAIEQACTMTAAVIAVGGGALLDPENRRRLLAAGPMVCLRASPEELMRRLGLARDRPLLNGDGTASTEERRARIEALLAERAPVYALATHAVDTDGLSPDEVAVRVRAILGAILGKQSGGAA
jgi:shikimate kinase